VLGQLIRTADIVVQNLAPGAAARIGADAASITQRFSRAVAVDMSGYGAGGPLGHKRAYDLLVQSEAGSCAAIAQREPHPLGDRVEHARRYSGTTTGALRREQRSQHTAHRVETRADIPDLAAVDRYATNADRFERRGELDEIITAWTSRHPLAELNARTDAAGLGNARLNSVRDVLAHPQLAKRNRWRDIDSPVGPLRALLPPFDSPIWSLAWTGCRRWASNPTPFSATSASTQIRSAACAPKAWPSRHDATAGIQIRRQTAAQRSAGQSLGRAPA
jgi:crotonobetainyl-CoA:carnitine CoA-transferase CaiB-like acyl-CoA transferase